MGFWWVINQTYQFCGEYFFVWKINITETWRAVEEEATLINNKNINKSKFAQKINKSSQTQPKFLSN